MAAEKTWQPATPRAARAAVTMALALLPPYALSATNPPLVHEGKAGFVVSDIAYALGPDGEESGACPDGMSLNLRQTYQLTPEGQRRPGESDMDYQQRLREGERKLSETDGKNHCMYPEVAGPDPHFRTVQGSDIPVPGIPLNGAATFGADPALAFPATNGEGAIENQYYRAVGCSRGWQPTGQFNGFAIGMLTGSWGIVIALEGVDDLRNDDHVTVGIHGNGDPIMLSPDRKPLAHATYAVMNDSRFQATTTGRIEDGVLTTEPVDVRFRHETNSMLMERPLRDARLRATISEEGNLEGYLAGYAPVTELYDYQFGFRAAVDPAGGPSPLQRRIGSSNGAADAAGLTCNGIYHALHQLADGHPDPETGRFTSISTQYRIEAIPAFVVASPAPTAQQTANSSQ